MSNDQRPRPINLPPPPPTPTPMSIPPIKIEHHYINSEFRPNVTHRYKTFSFFLTTGDFQNLEVNNNFDLAAATTRATELGRLHLSIDDNAQMDVIFNHVRYINNKMWYVFEVRTPV